MNRDEAVGQITAYAQLLGEEREPRKVSPGTVEDALAWLAQFRHDLRNSLLRGSAEAGVHLTAALDRLEKATVNEKDCYFAGRSLRAAARELAQPD